MNCLDVLYRVVGDTGEPITVTHNNFITTGWTIIARFTKASGEEYTITAVIVAAGGGAGSGVAAEYTFAFVAGNLDVPGDQEFDLHYTHGSLPSFSLPGKSKMVCRVRDS